METYGVSKTVREVLAELLAEGWRVVRNSRHLILRHPSGAQYAMCKTPSDGRRWRDNLRSDLRRSIATAQARGGKPNT